MTARLLPITVTTASRSRRSIGSRPGSPSLRSQASGSRLDLELGASDRGDAHARAGDHIGAGHRPAAVAELHAALAAQDRRIEHDDPADQAVASGVEILIDAAATLQ